MMNAFDVSNSVPPILSNNSKVLALETTLHQSIANFRELVIDFAQLHIESESYKTKFITQKEKCENKSCSSSETLMRIIEAKDHIIQLVASTLTRLNETKNFNILNEAFKILFGEKTEVNIGVDTKPPLISPKKELNSSLEDVSFREESVSEIEGTPTGRTSPIIQTKKLKSFMVTSSDQRDKKKCPENWSTPEKKAMKLVYPAHTRGGKPSGRMIQGRLKGVKLKQRYIVDLTCSPEFSGGCRTGRSDSDNVQPLIKKESVESDDTILPSPTSGPGNFTTFKATKDSPMKFKKPLSLKPKVENVIKKNSKLVLQNIENRCAETTMNDSHDSEDSINILNPNRLPKNFLCRSPVKQEINGIDTTYCDTQSSVSVLQHINKLDDINTDIKHSPSKQPLQENLNITNIPGNEELEASISLLQGEVKTGAVNYVKRKLPELAEVVYKEPAARKKAEKRLLQGWSCDECKHFFGELYKDDLEMLAKKIDECSKHRGKHNPARPKTPPNYWNPRWEVPNNTEEFNRKNNIV